MRAVRCTALGVALLVLLPYVMAAPAASSKDSKGTVKLVELIHKKQFEAVTKELSSNPDMDVNQPTPTGKLPLIEAVKVKDLAIVDALIQYYATVNVKEPGTGASPIMLAFQGNLVDIARLLLAYGADPSITAKNGKKATDAMTSAAIKELYAAWEKDGAMAFEEPPGTWKKAKSDDGADYWFNSVRKEGRWNLPPACGWQRVETQESFPSFTNYVTGQSLQKTPPSLCWRKVRHTGNEIWYNWAANITQFEAPDEMPLYLLDEAEKLINVRWYNSKTHQFSWEDPRHADHWRPVASEGEEGGMYYYNVVTGESQWEVPDDLAWRREEHEEHGAFWFNQNTGESTWEEPERHAWVRQDHDL